MGNSSESVVPGALPGALRLRVVEIARQWIGTPYHHQASAKGIGTDCLGLVRGVWRELYGFDAEVPPAYSRDWADASGHETMLEAASRHLIAVDPGLIGPADVVLFRIRPGMVAKHAGVMTSATTMIHAMEGAPVSEVAVTKWWRRKIAASFQFPEICPKN
jgi:NlpC/P60 family putative phage cell wall peptidase